MSAASGGRSHRATSSTVDSDLSLHRRASSASKPTGSSFDIESSSSEPMKGSPAIAPMTQSQRSRYLKTGGILAFILFIIFVLTPSSRTPQLPVAGPDSSMKCTKPHDSSKPLIQYALMIDAGSTGSRIHVYRFNNCGPTPALESEEFKMTEKKEGGSGLSSYREDAEGAAKSLDPLMEVAMKTVPEEYRSCSPIAVKATAGLRMLGKEMSDNILKAVRTRLETVYPFPVVSEAQGGVEIMEGKDEGVYAWITTNYLLGNIGSPEETPTAAIFDLGGGSTQIVFQPTYKGKGPDGLPEKMPEGDHKYALKFGGRDFILYQHSHLGYGLMAARAAIHRHLIETKHELSPNDKGWLKQKVVNPCIVPGMSRNVTVALSDGHALGKEVEVLMVGPKDPSAAQCRNIAEKILKKDAECNLSPCSFNGIHQPSLRKTFSKEDVFIFSYFYDRTSPLGMPESFTLHDLHELTSTVCGGEASWGVFQTNSTAMEELTSRPEYCLDLNFMLALLHTGYEMPLHREVKTAKKIDGNELGWCLGASLPLLSKNSGWECRVKQIS
ncbi:Guanosine-diphosphatase [Microsporum canis]|uniref:guanosine-diphosphatase n=1 Tax=Arthroderma otae (strain ATCC MYA-4605 / CBS 113480) TaxID=554155 RepID=C5FJS1_ARTOC|nr:guanosine-diphosphatase [Microsporum canis CBS 113480]EEQ30932.1 guanosine-diphosphatase [Microsporum canis CBS 113480]